MDKEREKKYLPIKKRKKASNQAVGFPSLFALAAHREAWVRDCWSDCIDGEGWHPSFSRSFND